MEWDGFSTVVTARGIQTYSQMMSNGCSITESNA